MYSWAERKGKKVVQEREEKGELFEKEKNKKTKNEWSTEGRDSEEKEKNKNKGVIRKKRHLSGRKDPTKKIKLRKNIAS